MKDIERRLERVEAAADGGKRPIEFVWVDEGDPAPSESTPRTPQALAVRIGWQSGGSGDAA